MVRQTPGISGCRRYLALVAVCGMTTQDPYLVQAHSFPALAPETQSSGEPHTNILPSLRLDGLSDEQSVDDLYTKIIPSLRLAARYDSNVYFVPGKDLEDYVTTVSPRLNLTRKNQWMDARVGGGATGEVYAKNSGLSYVGGDGTVDLNLDRAMNSLIQGLGLRVSDTVVYTPQPQAFALSTGGNQISQAFVPGLQTARVNTLSNIARVDASYFFSPLMGVSVRYTDQLIRFGQAIAAPTGAAQERRFNTNFQNLTSGLVGKPSPSDTVLLAHQFSDSNSGDGGFSTQGAIARWSRSITPALRTTVEGGFTVIIPSGDVQPVGVASLQWEGQYTTVQISYSRTVTASFLSVSTPLLSQVLDGEVRRHITEPLSVSLAGDYAVNQSVPDSSLVRFESYSVSPSLEYKIGQYITATLSYTRSEFKRAFAGTSFDFDRNMVMLSILAEWR
jgi:Putative beta-barrel porin 2